jgi:hypothetical protein
MSDSGAGNGLLRFEFLIYFSDLRDQLVALVEQR